MDIFDSCHQINDYLNSRDDINARNELIKLLDYHEQEGIEYDQIVNSLIRQTGLYPYLNPETSSWSDRLVYEAFKVDIGLDRPVTLHRDQSFLLKRLLDGKNIAVSAPTSFGKSFVIDAYISIKKPKNVAIIVPTIALTDETRRRIHQKFSNEYKIITTTEVELADKNILIFPQERAISYVDKISSLDILIIDEFYKASEKFDKERSSSLIRAMIKLGDIAEQKYFLAPNITSLNENPFTRDVEFIKLDFNTVFLEKHELFHEIGKDDNKKTEALLQIVGSNQKKTLIYAGTHSNVTAVSELITSELPVVVTELRKDFARWLIKNYTRNWNLIGLIGRGFGIHDGKLHRSLTQIQVKLFGEEDGLRGIISTSSIIEGVNTSAENVVIWRNRKGVYKLDDFTYKNIIGRGGRMFKHFIGKIYVLETPPDDTETQLDLGFPEGVLGDVDEQAFERELTPDQVATIIAYKDEMASLLGVESYSDIGATSVFQSSDSKLLIKIASDIRDNIGSWRGLAYLNSDDPEQWDRMLFKVLSLNPGGWETRHTTFVNFVKILSRNWTKNFPELLSTLGDHDIGIDAFFNFERSATYKLAALLNDVNTIQKRIIPEANIDISSFIYKVSHAFLPAVVYQLEEYGLPRMITKKIHQSGLLDFEAEDQDLHQVIDNLNTIGIELILGKVENLDPFDVYILKYFFNGISLNR